MDCLFCRIVAGEIPAVKVYEDSHTLAFMDINPVADGHTLVIPKSHHADVFNVPPEVLAHLTHSVQKVAKALYQGMGVRALNLLQNNGRAAFQSIDHIHFHLIPRREGDGVGFGWRLVAGDMEMIKAEGAKLAALLAE